MRTGREPAPEDELRARPLAGELVALIRRRRGGASGNFRPEVFPRSRTGL
jgi:hypothetical protein